MSVDPRDHIPELPDLARRRPDSPYYQQASPAPLSPDKVKPANHEAAAVDNPPAPPREETPPILPPLSPQGPPVVKPPPAAPSEHQQESKKPLASDEPLVAALRASLQRRPTEALDAVGRYPRANQEMLLVLLPVAARLTEGDIDHVSPREAAELADLVQGVEERLRRHAALRIDKMIFCRKIDDYGEYTARETINGIATFECGAGDQPGEPVQVYVELRNVSSRQHGDGYETRLAGSIELLDFEGQSAYRMDFAPEVHRGQSARHDFFVNCSFSVPRKVPPGRYTLRVEVRDITGLPAVSPVLKQAPPPHRIARQTLDLQVIEPKPERTAAR
jgi:hypothetical protein